MIPIGGGIFMLIMGCVTGMFFGYAAGWKKGRADYRPCCRCGSWSTPRHDNDWNIWCCVDGDGCRARSK